MDWIWLILVAVTSAQDIEVDVVRLRLDLEVSYEFEVNNTIEYILEFVQHDASLSSVPVRILLSSENAQNLHPITISARQNNGAVMYQIPEVQSAGGELVRYTSVARTLCPHNNLFRDDNSTGHCDEEFTDRTRVQVATTCSQSATLAVRVEPVRDFYVALGQTVHVEVAPSSPRYYFYDFEAGALVASVGLPTLLARWKNGCGRHLNETELRLLDRYRQTEETVVIPPRVHLIIESDDDVCATISIQNFTCPVFDNEREILYEGQYLTMMRSGSLQLDRAMYPNGFYMVFITRNSDEDCLGDSTTSPTTDIYELVVPPILSLLGLSTSDLLQKNEVPARTKSLQFYMRPSITYGQYALATGLAVLFYVTFYVLFVTAVLLFRMRLMRRFVRRAARNTGTPATGISYIGDTESRAVQSYTVTDILGNGNQRPLTRQSSSATLDDSDLSDSDDERPTARASQINPDSHPFGLPSQLRLAALAKHHARVLRARSNRYLWMVITVAVFYSLPVMQLVATYQRILNTNGDQDLCYYNFLCAHPLGVVSDFNHVVSNLGYAMLGVLFIVQVARRQHRQRKRNNDEEYGIPHHYGILYAMGVALIVEALLSGSYHICPNKMNFQFDMAFMYVMAVLCMVKIYQSRHPDVNARAHATFGVLAVIIALCLWGVLSNSTLFWTIFTVAHLATFLVLSLQIYYVGRFRLKGETMARAARELATSPVQAVRPMYTTRLVALLLANMANWFLAGFGLWNESGDIASHLLYILLGNTLLYTFFYLSMKLSHGERIRWYAWCFILAAVAFWAPAMYYFTNGSTNWATTPALSRHFNKPCHILEFFDSHDIWHFLSAIAMFMSFNMLLCWDDGLSATPRTDIAVF